MQNKKITVIGSISQSPFIQTDIDILSENYNVYPVNIYGNLVNTKLGRFNQYINLISTTLFNIIPTIYKSDIVYIWFGDVHALVPIITCKLLHKKSIVSIGGYEVSNMPEINYGMMRSPLSIRAKICKWVMHNADMCIAPSISYYIKSLPYVNSVLYSPDCIINYQYNENIKKQNIILMVGSATHGNYLLKGIPLYNKIAGQLNIPCYLIGSYDEDIKNKYHNIKYLGSLSHNEVMQWMNKSKIYCQLSATESFGVSILESIINGCIPVTTCIDDVGILIENCGYCSNDEEEILLFIQNSLNKNISKEIASIGCKKNNQYIEMRKIMFDYLINGEIQC
jgi:hypothetical protein